MTTCNHAHTDLADEEGIDEAIAGLEKVMKMEKDWQGKHGSWSFKALKRIISFTFKLGDEKRLMERFDELLTYNSKANDISENDLFKGIEKILNTVSTAAAAQTELALKLYGKALAAMKAAKNENLWSKTSLKLAQKMFDKGLHSKQLDKILAELEESCKLPDGSENPKKASLLLDVYALQIQLHMERKDRKKTKELSEKGFALAKNNPGILNSKLAIFHFVGGKLHMEQHNYKEAYAAFFEAFNFFEESYFRLKIPCLKYIVVATMLMLGEISPFADAQAKTHVPPLPVVSCPLLHSGLRLVVRSHACCPQAAEQPRDQAHGRPSQRLPAQRNQQGGEDPQGEQDGDHGRSLHRAVHQEHPPGDQDQGAPRAHQALHPSGRSLHRQGRWPLFYDRAAFYFSVLCALR